MRDCLDEGILQSYFDGELSGQQLESVASHLAACPTCAVTARDIEAETALLTAAFAPELEVAVPTEQLRRRIDAAIAGLQTQSAPVNESSPFSVRGWLQSLVAPFSLTPQRAFGYAGLVLVLGFATILGITQWRTAAPDPGSVAKVTPNTDDPSPSRRDLVATPLPAPSPALPEASPAKPATPSGTSPRSAPRRYASPVNVEETVANNTPKADDKVKLLPGERSYLQTIAKLDSTIKSSNRPMRPSLQAEYQRNLALVDRALAATRDAAKKNPNDPDAAEFMMTAYQNKVNLLNAVAEARTYNRQQD
jgi:Putative zinc-finger